MFAQNYDRVRSSDARDSQGPCTSLQALTHLMRCTGSNESKSIDLAIECIGKARNEILTNKLLEYLLGEKDQIPKVETTRLNLTKHHVDFTRKRNIYFDSTSA